MTPAVGVTCPTCGIDKVVEVEAFDEAKLAHRRICPRIATPWGVVWRPDGVELSAATRSIVSARFAAADARALGAVVQAWDRHVDSGLMSGDECVEALCRFHEGAHRLRHPLRPVHVIALVIPIPEGAS